MKRTDRLPVLSGAFLTILAGCLVLLGGVQVVHGAAYLDRAQRTTLSVETVPAARGRLLDRDGRVLAEDRASWSIVLDEGTTAAVRARLVQLCRAAGLSWDGVGDRIDDVPDAVAVALRTEPLDGVRCTVRAARVGSGTLAPHAVGRVGAMSPEEWDRYRTEGYAMDALVGKDGAEAAFEALLHGTPGRRAVERDRTTGETRTAWRVTPQRGRDVTLTLDTAIQQAAQDALTAYLADRPAAVGGAAVVLDVHDGGVLALVSEPGYDTATFSADYAALAADPARPLLDRAIGGLYAPGSTFKLVTAAAALGEGVLTPETEILDTGRYTYYKSPQPQCWLYRQSGQTHGRETVADAIADSCNIFFYDAGRRVGIDRLGDYARALGLGAATGIELAGERAGSVAGPETTAKLGGTWYEGSVLSAAIGQENDRATPLQLAQMTAALATGGTRWRPHLLAHVEGEGAYVPQQTGRLDLDPAALAAIGEGMARVVETGSLATAFRDVPVTAAAKTGSAQVQGAGASNAVLVCYAPAEDPQIAVALVAEQGGSGAGLGPVAAAIVSAWAQER